jgi:hypothetical protein
MRLHGANLAGALHRLAIPQASASSSPDTIRSHPFTTKCARDALPSHPLHFAELQGQDPPAETRRHQDGEAVFVTSLPVPSDLGNLGSTVPLDLRTLGCSELW